MDFQLRNYFVLLLLMLSSCSNEKLPKFTVIQGLRVLAVESDTPEINFDGATFTPNTVGITPLVSDLYGAGRGLSYNLEWCLDPGIAFGATPTCVGNPTRKIQATAQNVMATASFLAPNYTGSLTPVSIDFSTATAPALAVMGLKYSASTAPQLFNGLNLLIVFDLYVTASPTEKVSSVKRIIFSAATKAIKNLNPSGLEIRQNGVEITSLPLVESSLEAFLPSIQAESYSLMGSDGSITTKTEVLETTWFLTGPAEIECSKKKECSTDGLFSLSRTRVGEFNAFYIPQVSIPTSRGRVLIGVARDDRGGVVSKRYCTGTCP